jgi:hypothetical protein
MKKILFILSLVLNGELLFAAPIDFLSIINIESGFYQESIEDGWYNAIIVVRYESGDVTKEAVKIKVEIGYVVEVLLNDGKTYHSGNNSEGYEYKNGRVYFKSLSEDKSDASASVEILDINGGVTLMILLENYQANRIDDR